MLNEISFAVSIQKSDDALKFFFIFDSFLSLCFALSLVRLQEQNGKVLT